MKNLRRQLQEAELAAAVSEVANTLRNVSGGPSRSNLEPTIVSQVEVNGVSTDSLLDTGLPVTLSTSP